ncbi:MAG: TetR/AcrR family transcriptional regulator [Clostridiales bacterium]|jgi:AcrR family transcriptional regulator|nr:TetR/AcrR family transcriptional regulator [Clostridiales bacterium]
MEATNAQSRRDRILRAAEALFSAKGFGDVSVDAIAREAGVNKATIYYYFPSKQAVLDHLIDAFLQSLADLSLQAMRCAATQGVYSEALAFDGEGYIRVTNQAGMRQILHVIDAWFDAILDFFTSRRSILRIMMAESIKDGGNRALLYRLSDLLGAPGAVTDQMQALGFGKLAPGLIIMKFFGGFLPIAHYAVNAQNWCEHYAMDDQTLRSGLKQLFQMEITGFFHLPEKP